MVDGRARHIAALLANGKVLVAGGQGGSSGCGIALQGTERS
jgi:hypothetical protein